jgi:hypothetical protein
MFQIRTTRRRGLTVTSVADDVGLLEGLERYLHSRVSFRAAPALGDATTILAASDVVVFYPDGFPAGAAQRFLRRLIDQSTIPLVIVVSRDAQRFRELGHSRATANRFIVLGWPAWPWELFATIQAALPGPPRGDDTWSC